MSVIAFCLIACLSLDLSIPKDDQSRPVSYDKIVDLIGVARLYSPYKIILKDMVKESYKQNCIFCEKVPEGSYDVIENYFDAENISMVTIEHINMHLSRKDIEHINTWLDSDIGKKLIHEGGLATPGIEAQIKKEGLQVNNYEHQLEVERFVKVVFSKKLFFEYGVIWGSVASDPVPTSVELARSLGAGRVDKNDVPPKLVNSTNDRKNNYTDYISELLPFYIEKLKPFNAKELVLLTDFFNTEVGYKLSVIYLLTLGNVMFTAYEEGHRIRYQHGQREIIIK